MLTIIRAQLAAASLLFAGAAASAEWQHFGGTDFASIFLDTASHRRSGKVVKVWVRWEYNEPQTDHSTNPAGIYTSAVTQYAFDCRAESMAVLQEVRYGGKLGGEVIASASSSDKPDAYVQVVPDSVARKLLDSVCAPRLRNGSKQ